MSGPDAKRSFHVRDYAPILTALLALHGWMGEATGSFTTVFQSIAAWFPGWFGTPRMVHILPRQGPTDVRFVEHALDPLNLMFALPGSILTAIVVVAALHGARVSLAKLARRLPFAALYGAGWALAVVFAVWQVISSHAIDEVLPLFNPGAVVLLVTRHLERHRLAPPTKRAEVRVTNRIAVRSVLLFAVGLITLMLVEGVLPAISWLPFWALLLVPLALLASSFRPRAEVGSDGLYIPTLRRFVPWHGDEDVVPRDRWFAVQRHGRTVLRLEPVTPGEAMTDVADVLTRAIAGASKRPATTAEAVPATDATKYRVNSLPREELWRIVEAHRLPLTVRADAARELAREPHESDEARLDDLAEQLADPAARKQLAARG